ncbi:MAG: D-2-hydroxyacid dehydrogenase [Chloroflexota bacterium]
MTHRENPRVLVLDDQPHLYMPLLKARFPALVIEACVDDKTAVSTAARLRPQIIFSWKNPAIANETQRQIILAPETKWVQVGGAGFDHLLPLDKPDLIVTNTSGVMTHAMVETVMGAILLFNFRYHDYIAQQRQKQWQQLPWLSLRDKTVLIIGLGYIGTAVAAQAKQFGMTVIGMRNQPRPTPHVDELIVREQLGNALARADFVCLHAPHTAQTHHMLGTAEFAQMRPDAYLINTARGGLVNEAALIRALQTNQIAGAYLDVFDHEPLSPTSPLWEMSNVIITPHVSDSTTDWPEQFTTFFADNLDCWLAGKPLRNVIDLARGY